MEIDRELLEGCLDDMKMAHQALININETFGVPVFLTASMLALRIVDVEVTLKDAS